MNRYDLLAPRKRNDKTYWHRVGAAFPSQKGGFSLVFDSLPVPDEKGEVRLMMWEAKPRDQQRQQGQSQSRDIDDDIPF